MLRIGLIGCGFATRDRHLPALAHVADARVVALADIDDEAVTELADRWSVARRYATTEALVADPDVEAVAVCVPAAAHVNCASEALAAGKPVLLEKPIALTLDDADSLLEAARRSGVPILMGFNLRWHPLVRRARDLIREGAVGPVVSVRTAFSDPLLSRPSVRGWRVDRTRGGGALFDKAVHHFDLWRFLLDDEVERVVALGHSRHADDDAFVVSACMGSGAIATTYASDTTSIRNDIEVFGEDAHIEVSCYRFDGLSQSPVFELPGAARARLRRFAESARSLPAALSMIPRGGYFLFSYVMEWRHFVDVATGSAEPGCTLTDGRRSLEIALAANQAASTLAAAEFVSPTTPTTARELQL